MINSIFPKVPMGLIPTTNALMVVFFQVFITRITRKYPPLPVMALGSLLYAIGVGSVALGGSFIAFWASMVIMTLGELMLMPTASTYVAHLAPADMRGRYMSISGLTWNVAYGLAPVTGGYLSDNIAPRAIWIGGLVTGLAAFLGLFLLAKTIQTLKARQRIGKQALMIIQEISPGNRKLIQQFLSLPQDIYRNIPQWVPPLSTDSCSHFRPHGEILSIRQSQAAFFLALDPNGQPNRSPGSIK